MGSRGATPPPLAQLQSPVTLGVRRRVTAAPLSTTGVGHAQRDGEVGGWQASECQQAVGAAQGSAHWGCRRSWGASEVVQPSYSLSATRRCGHRGLSSRRAGRVPHVPRLADCVMVRTLPPQGSKSCTPAAPCGLGRKDLRHCSTVAEAVARIQCKSARSGSPVTVRGLRPPPPP